MRMQARDVPPGLCEGGGPARLRRIKEFVQAKMEDELTLIEMGPIGGVEPLIFQGCFASRRVRHRTGLYYATE